MKGLHMVAYVLLWVGGVNWGLLGVFGFDLVNALLGTAPALERLVYILVGVATVYVIATHKEYCKYCGDKK